jgi:2-keto-4-pentenoate hydratase
VADVVEQAASALACRRNGSKGPVLTDACRPTSIAHAIAIQAAVAKQLGTHIGGWKCGMPSRDRITVGGIHADTIFSSSPCPVWAPAGTVRIEPELAFTLKHDLPVRTAPYSQAEIDAAIGSAHLALELIDTRYADDAAPAFLDQLADGLFNQGLFIGPEVDLATALAAEHIDIQWLRSDGTTAALAGQHPAGKPANPLYWLVEWLRKHGDGLSAGQPIITGSYVGTFAVPVGEPISLGYRGLGDMRVTFSAHEPSITAMPANPSDPAGEKTRRQPLL